MNSEKKPKVIFLDAVGTIFGVKQNVGSVYCHIAQKYGVEADGDEINKYFYDAFKQSDRLAFGKVKVEEVRKLEYIWWKKIAYITFKKANLIDSFSDFNKFFLELYRYFKTDGPWFVYDEIETNLQQWQKEGIELGIISNFDTRIYSVLDSLKLKSYFQTITISSLAGVAKPDPKIFLQALRKHNCSPEDAWYIGDTFKDDYLGAKSVGMKSLWLKRRS